jgi:molybdenum cofactor cytidylyltransferase
MDAHTHTAAIILAAGTSRRMGEAGNKLLLPLHNRPVLSHVLQAVHGSQARPIILVLGYQAREVQACLEPELREQPAEIVVNTDYAQGQSTSLKSGLRTLLRMQTDPSLTAAIFVLGDQPLVSSALIDQLIMLREHTGQRIALPRYRGQRGNPVVFSLQLAPCLLQISGDEGGRSLIQQYAQATATLDVDEEGANLDVDTWAAYLQVQAAWPQQSA